MTLIKWKPNQLSLNEFDRMINDIFNDGWNFSALNQNQSPAVDIVEDKDKFYPRQTTLVPPVTSDSNEDEYKFIGPTNIHRLVKGEHLNTTQFHRIRRNKNALDEFDMEVFEQQLDRFIEMFELALAEQKMDEVIKRLEELVNEQTNIIKELTENDNINMTALSSRERRQEENFIY